MKKELLLVGALTAATINSQEAGAAPFISHDVNRTTGAQIIEDAQKEGKITALQAVVGRDLEAFRNAPTQLCTDLYQSSKGTLAEYDSNGIPVGSIERNFQPGEMCITVIIDGVRISVSGYCGNKVLTPVPTPPIEHPKEPEMPLGKVIDCRRPSAIEYTEITIGTDKIDITSGRNFTYGARPGCQAIQ